jgi:UDPglucose 6-dehydrogenase
MMEICHKTGADVDSVSDAMSLATDRLISSKYLRGGMGDGGGCHPRDNIALSWLAQKLNLSHDIFNNLMLARENQTGWFADLIEDARKKYKLPIIILGKSFKSETNLTIGSPAILLANILRERKIPFSHYEPHLGETIATNKKRAIYFLGTKHDVFKNYKFAKGSLIFDPFGYVVNQSKITIISIGRQKK